MRDYVTRDGLRQMGVLGLIDELGEQIAQEVTDAASVGPTAEKSPASEGSEAAADIARERRLSAHSIIGDQCAGVAGELSSSQTHRFDRIAANGTKPGHWNPV